MKRFSTFAASSYRWQIRRRRSSRSVREKTSPWDTTTEHHHDPPWGCETAPAGYLRYRCLFPQRSSRYSKRSLPYNIRNRERGSPSSPGVAHHFLPSTPKEISRAIFPSSKSTPPPALLFSTSRTRDAIYQRDPHPQAGERGFIAIIQQTKGKREKGSGYVLTRYSASFILLSRDSVV